MTSLLKAKGIEKQFGGIRALRKVDFTLEEASVHALLGENGAGKSTLIKIFSGVYPPDEGEIEIDGKVLKRLTPSLAKDCGIATIYQETSLYRDLSVLENLFMGRQPKSRLGIINWNFIREEAIKLFNQLGVDIPLTARLCFWIARQGGVPVSKGAISKKELFADFMATLPAMAMPILILVAMITGVATPTEVSVLAVFYAIGVSGLLYRDLTIKKIYSAMIRAGVATGVVMLIIMASSLIGWILTIQNVPTRLTEWFLSLTHSSVIAIGFMNCVMLFVGTFLDMPAAILLLGPVFLPLAEAIHLDLVQLGVMMTLNLAIGLFTPPVGTTLFISSTIAEIKIEDTVKALMPFYICSLLVMLLISYVPALTITP